MNQDTLRQSRIAIVAGNLAMLHWFRGRGAARRTNRTFHVLVLGVCLFGMAVLLVPAAGGAFGFPVLQPGAVLAWLSAPCAWALRHLWKEGRHRTPREAAWV